MGLLDGDIRAAFGAIFGAFYLDGQLLKRDGDAFVADGKGGGTFTPGSIPIKLQPDNQTRALILDPQRPEVTGTLIVLQAGLSTQIKVEDDIVLGPNTWTVKDVQTDPASSHWICKVQSRG